MMAAQASLQHEWLHGKHGGLCAREQMKAWALREVWKEQSDTVYGLHVWIAARVTKVGGGNPTNVAINDLLMKMDADEDWFPGKQYGEKRGRKRVLTGVKALAVANCAQSKKAKGGDPTYGHVCGAWPRRHSLWPGVQSPKTKRICCTCLSQRGAHITVVL